ncbi:PQQ-binding-like beta-propeller repeat protein [Streptomyces spinoverrucosus]|uniref:serine/threonine-protein kinase n=1 Tax=Streptomyces spinoverrucosus TaxID=284043 RepID=UPI0018C3EA0D|nr:serine/threonine-protein kinase [Streptomyces spinoverrucosus]MBG0857640.1 PQQ-binding-like beta-propeller repeat protein [Streptomyces spinoverrucosus]
MQPLRPDDPERVGGHRLLARLGAGGMGVVYLGRTPGGRLAAVKLVHEHFGADAHYRARFRREVAAARTVTGTFTAPVLDADPDAAVPWLAMEYLPGLSLREAVESFGALPSPALRLLAAALAEALAGIHRAGLAHRDLKPRNVMLTASGPRLIDFGIARPLDATAITQPGALLGTPGFMSPEQASGGLAGPAGDVFSLGAVLAYTATGRPPFDAADRAATLERVRLARADLDGIKDRRLRSLVAACLRREPEHRLSAVALLDRLGEPADMVYGTGWLPAPLAEAIDRRSARARPEPHAPAPPAEAIDRRSTRPQPEPHAAAPVAEALHSETTADPDAVTADAPEARTTGPSRPPDRRKLLMAVAAVPVAIGAAVVLAEKLLPEEGHPASRPSGRASPSRSATVRPPVATRRWRRKALDDTSYPDLYPAGDVVLAANSGRSDVHALDARTGRILWSRAATTSGPADHIATGPEAVYLFDARDGDSTEEYVLRAVNPVSGSVRWTSRVPFFPWGTAATASVLCVAVHNEVRALDVKDGRRRWTAQATGMSLTARAELAVASGERVMTGLDAGSGRIRWRYEMPESPLSTLVSDGMVFTSDTLGTLYAVHADDGKAAWKHAFDYRSSARHAGSGMVYVSEPDGRIRAFQARTGKQAWSRRPGRDGTSSGESQTLGVSDGTLWIQGPDQTVYALDTADGSTLWTYGALATVGSVTDHGSGALAVAGLVLLGTDGGHVEAVSPPSPTKGTARGTA